MPDKIISTLVVTLFPRKRTNATSTRGKRKWPSKWISISLWVPQILIPYSFPLCSRSFFYLFISFFLRFRYPQGFSNPCFFFYIRFLTKEKSSYCEKYLSFAWLDPSEFLYRNFTTVRNCLYQKIYNFYLVPCQINHFSILQLSFILLPVHSYFPNEQNFYNSIICKNFCLLLFIPPFKKYLKLVQAENL